MSSESITENKVRNYIRMGVSSLRELIINLESDKDKDEIDFKAVSKLFSKYYIV